MPGHQLWKTLISLQVLVWSLPATSLAKTDPDYNPNENFRPNNVTGLDPFYTWVGSYYNATAEIELTPVMGRDVNTSLCPNMQNYTDTVTFRSILSITERGPYNSGIDPVNIWLTLLPPNVSVSELGGQLSDFPGDGTGDSPAYWPVVSSPPTLRNMVNDSASDYFNFTVSKTPNNLYNISWPPSNSAGSASGALENVPMRICNQSAETADWFVFMETNSQAYWSIEGWDNFTLPDMIVLFDDRTANLTLNGDFYAYPWPEDHNISSGNQEMDFLGAVQGSIQIRFSGVLDAYHSDILEMKGTIPTWQRTVGFGNNSQNVGYGVSSSAVRSYFLSLVLVTSMVMLTGSTIVMFA